VNSDNFAQWIERQGRNVYRSESTYWHEQGPKVLQAFPYHQVISPSDEEINGFLLRTKTVGLRYSTPLQARIGKVSYHVVYEKENMDFLSLPKKVRNDVRAGLNHVRVEPIPFSRLATDGWPLTVQTMQRQGRHGAETKESWERLCASAENLPGFEAWGAIHDQELVAAILVFSMEDTASILYQRSATAHMKYGINNALAYTFTNEALSRPGITRIFYGLHSLDAPASVDEFKFRMGYIARPVRQRVVFNPLVSPLFSNASYYLIRGLQARPPANHILAKAEGLLRFYLQGLRSLPDQDWPSSILDQRPLLLQQAAV
jgi:hypothetical protein